MTLYTLEFADGRVTDITADNDLDAIASAESRLEGDVVTADQWDADGKNDEDQTCERILFWADDESAKDDAGQKAIASLHVVRR